MTASDLLQLIVGAPVAILIGAYFGRKIQRYLWKLDKPYDERVQDFKLRKAA